jgi:hypothetical protein
MPAFLGIGGSAVRMRRDPPGMDGALSPPAKKGKKIPGIFVKIENHEMNKSVNDAQSTKKAAKNG